MSEATVILFPNVDEITAADGPELDLNALVLQQGDLLGRWRDAGTEVKRLTYDLPIGLLFEIAELIRLTDDIPIIN
jgi:hypothetical protein